MKWSILGLGGVSAKGGSVCSCLTMVNDKICSDWVYFHTFGRFFRLFRRWSRLVNFGRFSSILDPPIDRKVPNTTSTTT